MSRFLTLLLLFLWGLTSLLGVPLTIPEIVLPAQSPFTASLLLVLAFFLVLPRLWQEKVLRKVGELLRLEGVARKVEEILGRKKKNGLSLWR